jgi:hypothetical protein
MATWKAECWLGSKAGRQTLEVQASSLNGAKEQLQRVYGAEQICNLREVRNNSSGSSGGSEGSFEGSVALIGLIAAAWAFMSFTPWILMGLGGAAGAWIGEKVTGQSIEDYNERDDDLGHGKAGIVLALALILGGVGFVQGDSLKKEFDAPSDTPAQVRPKN